MAAMLVAALLCTSGAQAQWLQEAREALLGGGGWVTLGAPRWVPPAAPATSASLMPLVRQAAQRHGLDARLLQALITVESGFQPTARSPKGALGLMQIMPSTGARYGVDNPRQLYDPTVNIDVGARYLRDLHVLFDGRVDLALAAYNAGEAAVMRYGGTVPPFRETRDYVEKILAMLGASPS